MDFLRLFVVLNKLFPYMALVFLSVNKIIALHDNLICKALEIVLLEVQMRQTGMKSTQTLVS